MRNVVSAASLVVALCAAVASAQESEPLRERIVDVIAELETQGVTVIYGSDLLPDSLTMERVPGAESDLAALDAALQLHGLTLRPGPRDTWLVVLAPEPPEEDETAESRPERLVFGPPSLENIVVSASRYAFSRATGPSTAQLDRRQLLHAPTLGSDAIRATHALPGLTSSGLTARVNVRGGDSDEALIIIDGLRLFNPFHLKDFQSLFSSINPQIVDSMSVYTGAYPAEYGDRMSAVIDIRTLTPTQHRLHEIGVSTLNSSVLSAGRFADDRGTWLTSMRRGNLDLLIDAANSDLGTPQYYDLFNKLEYSVSPKTNIKAGLLVLNDKISLNDSDIATAHEDYRDAYFWVGMDYSSDRLDFDVLVSLIDNSTNRDGTVDDPHGSVGSLADERKFESRAVRASWTYAINDSHWLRTGVEYRDSDASYDFQSQKADRFVIPTPGLARPPQTIDEFVAIEGERHAVFLSYRAQPVPAITTELGLRWDRQDLPADRQLSPRFNVLYDVGERFSVRASWGRYFQAHSFDELQIADGVTNLYPAQESEHTVLGVEYLLGDAASIRLEAYRKEFELLRPRFENLFDRVSLLPELQPDRVMIAPLRGEASGVELSMEGENGPWQWWVNLARSRTRDVFADSRADRSWEEPWSFKGGLLWSGNKWTVSLATTWHTGWPITDLALIGDELSTGQLNGSRLPNFSSVDLRASRSFALERSELEWFVELNNALNAENPCCLEFDVELDSTSRPQSLNVSTDNWLAAIPTIGFVWRLARETR